MRRLTLEGKILLVKTLGISKLIFSLHTTFIRQIDIKNIEKIIFDFIWCGRDKIKRDILQSNFEKGGLRAPDIFAIDKSIKLKLFFNLGYNSTSHPVSVSWYRNLLNNGFVQDGQLCSISDRDYYKYSSFITSAINSKLLYNRRVLDELVVESDLKTDIRGSIMIANTSLISISQNQLIKNHAFRLSKFGIRTVLDIYKDSQPHRFFLEKLSMKNQIPRNARSLIESEINKLYVDDNIYILYDSGWGPVASLKNSQHRKFVKNVFLKPSKICTTKSMGMISNDCSKIFANLRKHVKDTTLRDFQYKLIHNIVQNRKKIFQYNYISDPFCLSCSENGTNLIDDNLHSFFLCPCTIATFNDFRKVVRDLIGIEITYDIESMITGIITKNNRFSNQYQNTAVIECAIELKKRLHSPVDSRKMIPSNVIKKTS